MERRQKKSEKSLVKKEKKELILTEGNITSSLLRFALPVLLALFLQALYGGADMLIVGQFASTADLSGVSTGSNIMHTLTMIATGLSMGMTIMVGQLIGAREPKRAGQAVGSGIVLFAIFALLMTTIIVTFSSFIAQVMQAPEEAFNETVQYVRICGGGFAFIVAYNILGSIFRGIGDSKTPFMTVAIACVCNILGDLLLVAVFGLGAAGAAIATVSAQGISVLISLLIIRKKTLPFVLSRKDIRLDRQYVGHILHLGCPIALQEFLVGISFLFIQMIANSIGLVESAGIGVGEKVCAFIMLVPSAYSQSMAAFAAQNVGAQKHKRATRGLWRAIFTSLGVGVVIGYVAFFHGDMLSGIFSNDVAVIGASQSYLKAYAIDCLLTPFLFCMIGYFNGYGKALFVMIQGIVGAFFIRIPVAFLMSHLSANPSLFKIGIATPCSTIVQITLCLVVFWRLQKDLKGKEDLSQLPQ